MKRCRPILNCLAGVILCAVCCRAAPVDILVLQTADVHGALGSSANPDEGDWRRLAATVRRLRQAHGPERTLLVDCGDTCQGSFAAQVTGGRVGIAMLKCLAVDAWIPGNHDLDFGPAALLAWCRSDNLPVLCGNLAVVVAGQRHEFPAWQRFERGGARIALIGATASYMRHWLWGETARQIDVETAAALLERVLPEILRESPDLVVLATHQGYLESDPRGVNEVRDLALRFPEIDLILGAHTHRPFPGLKIGPATWYVQPGALATHVAAVRVRLEPRQHRILELTSELVPAAEEAATDLGTEVSRIVAQAEAAGAKQVCRLAQPLPPGGTPGVNCAVSELLCRALAEAARADVVLHGTLGRTGLPAGTVSERDLFALVPYENSVTVADFTPRELEAVVAEQIENRSSYVYCGVWGADFTVQTGKNGRSPRVRLTAIPGRSGPLPERLRVAMNSYTAAGGGGRFPRLMGCLRSPQSRCRSTGIQTRDAVRSYLQRHAQEAVTPRAWITGRLSLLDGASVTDD
jgi:2',3'-cyclic-nucleotide 2'-phosphodiesterase (5'-nucleotidase family)